MSTRDLCIQIQTQISYIHLEVFRAFAVSRITKNTFLRGGCFDRLDRLGISSRSLTHDPRAGNKNSQHAAHLFLQREPPYQAVRNTDSTGRSEASLVRAAVSFAEIVPENLLGTLLETCESFAH